MDRIKIQIHAHSEMFCEEELYIKVALPWAQDCGECWKTIATGQAAMVVKSDMDKYRPVHPACLHVIESHGHELNCTHGKRVWSEHWDDIREYIRAARELCQYLNA